MPRIIKIVAGALATCLAATAPAKAGGTALDWRAVPLPAIDGGTHGPEQFLGHVVLVVNTASRCGFTGQYQGLQSLWRENRDRGLVVLGIPSNDFGAQEPGNSAQVQEFCQINYGVDFPLLEKQTVVGNAAHPLYRWAAAQTGPLGVPRWNFHKLLIGRDGRLVDWFASTTAPDSERLRHAIDSALAEK
ncbi:glutathione peroxidase [Magnetospirillum gryphiswaldense]|uniref:Glutathione peroxidase n=1 Tax=Magnetospirillum gryphiswaldense TaxID=55518 RepID=A4TY35_9PROT|nr:glutathione peroxidase [Magnetospirillum gryphiswaldense]AVM76047.1 Hydroperoxy fatty acid reductase gpx1 [Magnetospirillum gryphiswaldense MSR-1]AVM79950.1 Hydroperoxy fatty acid reductase gpx1 [Magnetospirillum gryphiswaldense]CAM75542.1 glutathione peroxidase [Magnetospirillum gryphiswaldense MSR-1]